ncbi:MAG: DUF4884 domain-containing protein [Halobacteriota archaeon]|jgi:hypothetical protein
MKLFPFITRVVLPLALLASLVACEKDPVAHVQTDNKNISVDLLFEHNGCTVYRFWDMGEPIYYSNCGGSTQTSWRERHGKTTVAKNVSVSNDTR